MKAPAEPGRLGVRLTAPDMARVRALAATLRKGSGRKPLVLGGLDAAATADAIAGELRLNVYRVDLSRVVSKYIGETEKNLARVFQAAEANAAILVFDEADALFGKRTDVKDSHDRYANAEINALLRGLRGYDGLVAFVSTAAAAMPTKLRHHFSFHRFPPVEPR